MPRLVQLIKEAAIHTEKNESKHSYCNCLKLDIAFKLLVIFFGEPDRVVRNNAIFSKVGLTIIFSPLNVQGLTFPPDAGFPFDSSKERFYMMTTHYHFSNVAKEMTDFDATTSTLPLLDNSGLRIFVTPNLRSHDAGVLSIGK